MNTVHFLLINTENAMPLSTFTYVIYACNFASALYKLRLLLHFMVQFPATFLKPLNAQYKLPCSLSENSVSILFKLQHDRVL